MTTDRAIVPSPLEVEAPPPGAVFLNRVINPRNVSITEAAQAKRDKPLSRQELKQLRSTIRALEKQLKAAGYSDKRRELQIATARFLKTRLEQKALKEQLLKQPDPELETRCRELTVLMSGQYHQQRRLQEEVKVLLPLARKHRALIEQRESHFNALAQRKLHAQLRKEMAEEAHRFEEIITETYSQLGFKYDIQSGKKRRVHRVRFSEIHCTPDQTYLKIASSMKTFTGFRSLLPQGVRVLELTKPETLLELTNSCQRQIQAKLTMNNGAWLIINRTGTRDGLLEYVTLEQVLNKYDYHHQPYFPVPLGVGVGRVISWVQVAHYPHFLIGGSTGGGKSNIENVIISTLAQKHSPAQLRFILIDLKEGLEFRTWEQLPHLLIPPITEVQDAARVLGQLEGLRKERAQRFARVWARTLDEYNARVPDVEKMPRIVVIFDEYAAIAINKDAHNTIQSFVLQLLNKGRATGIHIILCTQNPSVDIIPGPQKANMAFRLAGPMPTKAASMTILGTGDAAELPDVRGRMIAMVGAKFWQIQTPHVRPQDIERALEISEEWPQAQHILLPEPSGVVGFTQDTLIELALEEFAGRLSVKPIYDAIKDTENVSYRGLQKMVKELVQQKQIVYQNASYHFEKKRGGGYAMVAD